MSQTARQTLSIEGGPHPYDLTIVPSAQLLKFEISSTNSPVTAEAKVYVGSLDLLAVATATVVAGHFLIRIKGSRGSNIGGTAHILRLLNSRLVEVTHERTGKPIPFTKMSVELTYDQPVKAVLEIQEAVYSRPWGDRYATLDELSQEAAGVEDLHSPERKLNMSKSESNTVEQPPRFELSPCDKRHILAILAALVEGWGGAVVRELLDQIQQGRPGGLTIEEILGYVLKQAAECARIGDRDHTAGAGALNHVADWIQANAPTDAGGGGEAVAEEEVEKPVTCARCGSKTTLKRLASKGAKIYSCLGNACPRLTVVRGTNDGGTSDPPTRAQWEIDGLPHPPYPDGEVGRR